jgi:hypothetical protein
MLLYSSGKYINKGKTPSLKNILKVIKTKANFKRFSTPGLINNKFSFNKIEESNVFPIQNFMSIKFREPVIEYRNTNPIRKKHDIKLPKKKYFKAISKQYSSCLNKITNEYSTTPIPSKAKKNKKKLYEQINTKEKNNKYSISTWNSTMLILQVSKYKYKLDRIK